MQVQIWDAPQNSHTLQGSDVWACAGYSKMHALLKYSWKCYINTSSINVFRFNVFNVNTVMFRYKCMSTIS